MNEIQFCDNETNVAKLLRTEGPRGLVLYKDGVPQLFD